MQILLFSLSLFTSIAAFRHLPFTSHDRNITGYTPRGGKLVLNHNSHNYSSSTNIKLAFPPKRTSRRRPIFWYALARRDREARLRQRTMTPKNLHFPPLVAHAELRRDTVADARPTPEPTGDPSPSRTVHVKSEKDFSLIAPNNPGESISDAETEGTAYCFPGSDKSNPTCARTFPPGFITAAAIKRSPEGQNRWIQITGCIDPAKFDNINPSDLGGQFDVRFPNGAQCTFGGYGASFIEQIEPATRRFCLRCCVSPNDQKNCNSHLDRQGCLVAVPGIYDFPHLGITCS